MPKSTSTATVKIILLFRIKKKKLSHPFTTLRRRKQHLYTHQLPFNINQYQLIAQMRSHIHKNTHHKVNLLTKFIYVLPEYVPFGQKRVNKLPYLHNTKNPLLWWLDSFNIFSVIITRLPNDLRLCKHAFPINSFYIFYFHIHTVHME